MDMIGVFKMVLSEIRVLICDDSILVRKKMTDLMTKLGCKEIYTATDGEDAVEQYKKNLPDITFMDIVMPKLNGNESAATIRMIDREDARTIPIIAITALNSETDRQMMRESGMDGFLQKPLSIPAVKEIIEQYSTKNDN